MGRPHPQRFRILRRLLAPLCALACAIALVAGAGAQGGLNPIAPADSGRQAVPETTTIVPDTGLARPEPSLFDRPDSVPSPDSLLQVAADSARTDSLVYDSARGGWRVVVPVEDSLRAAAIQVDRSSWITWTPRLSKLALPILLLRDGLFTPDEPWQLRYPVDARSVRVDVDAVKGTITQSLSAADVPLDRVREIPLEDYAKDLTARNLRREWVEQSARRINNVPAAVANEQQRGPLNFRLPSVLLPSAAQSILGRGGPSLNVSGSERISIAGTSNWDNLTSGTGVKRSLFPSLDMKQDLDIRLDGSLGDKVRVDVAQNSATTVPLANRIGIRYTGYEDEILKNLDLGNTNLSLPGTQYVSYSGRNEGLFGVKAAARVGGTDLAVIASKQEGRSERRSFQGTSQEITRTIDDLNYVKGKYFFLERPIEQLESNSRIDVRTVQVFVDNGNGSDNQGVRAGYAEVDPTQAPGATARLKGDFDGLRPLQDYEVSSFYYGERFPILILKNAIASSQVLAVSYEEVLADGTTRRTIGVVPAPPADPNAPVDSVRLKLLQAPRDQLKGKVDNTDFYETDPAIDPLAVTREYELRNVYDLQTINIDPKSLNLTVRRYDAATVDATDAYKEGTDLFTYLRIMGADLFKDNGTGTPLEGPDELTDQFTGAYWLDTERGILFFPDLRPFDPRVGPRPDRREEEEFFFKPRIEADQTIPGLRGRIFWPPGLENPPGVPGGGPTPEELEANRNPYDKRNIQQVQDRRYYISAKFSGQDYSGTINLGQFGILEGSEVVAIEGVPLERNKDYSIDYEAGTVTLLTARAQQNRSRLSIDYSYAPLFDQAGKTLVGGTVGFRDARRSMGGAFIYESKGQQETRPRLGEEPSKTLIGDVYGDFRLKPQFLTDLADRLPFYSTTEPSQLDINGEVGISMPNPNTKNTVYIDDFEGNRDSWSAPMTRAFWKWPAPPEVIAVTGADTVEADYAELIWYNPVNTIHARDLNPRLTDAEGADNVVTALDFYIPKAPAVRNHPESMWTGITTTVEPDGADFSRLQYLELWINDWNDPDVRMDPDLKLHIDLGLISEDQQRAPGVPPNNLYDTEDVNRDGKYDQSTDPATREDPGADAVPNELETDLYDLSTATDLDPHGDNWRQSDADLGDNGNVAERLDPVNYIGPTLSEKSKGTYEVGSRLFTEDLNNNQSLDAINQYVTYTLRLGDEASLAPFLIFDAQTTPNLDGSPVAPNNGWRRYRIPLDASDSVKTVIRGGSLSNVKHLRVWLEGITNFKGNDVPRKETELSPGRQPLIQVAAIDVVGNRWRIAGADSALSLANGSVVARNINNQEDRNIYDPPFGVATTSSGGSTETEREQSIALEVTRLPVGSTASIFKDGTLAEDYTRYGRIGFYQTAFGFTDEDSARFFLRMGYDDRNYYEYSRPIRGAPTAPSRPTPWNEIQLDLTDFTDVKLNRPAGVLADTVARGDERFIVFGQPTFTRIQRLSVGAYSEKAYTDSSNEARAPINMSGQIWIDELRALNVDRSRGLANRLTVYAKVADLFTLTTNWDRTDENFQRLGQLRGSDIRSNRISFVGQFQPHRFAAHSGVLLPISFGYTKNTSIPRLRTGTDVFLRGEDALDEQSQSVDRNFSVSLQKQGDRNPILRNTIGRMGINFSFSDRVGKSPTARDSSRSLSSGISYSIAPAEWFRVPIPIWKLRAGGVQRLKLLPETATISYTQTTARTFTFKRGLEDPVGLYSLQSDIYRKQSAYQLGATWRPLPFGSYALSATRNAHIPGVPPAYILGINFGRMTNFNQRIDGRFTLPVHSFFRPSFDFATNYTEARTPDLSPTLQLGTFANATNAGVRWELPFTRLAARRQPPPQQPQPPPPSPGPSRTSFVDSTAADTSATGTVTPPPPPPPPPPSGGGFSLPVGAALSRIGNVNMSITFSRTTAFSRYTGVPSVPYRMGLTKDPDVQWSGDELQSIFPGPQATDNQQRTYTGDASTTVGLIGRATARVRFNYSNLSRIYNSQISNSQNTTFPDIQFDWGQVTNVLRLGKVFSAINAQSKLSIVRTLEGSDLDTPTSRVRTQNLSPLLQLSGQMRSTANVQLSLDRRTATREEFSIRRALRKEGDTTVRGSISRSYLPGQKMPIFGGKGLKSTLTLTLDGSFNKRANSTESTNLPPTRTKTDKLDFNGSGTYSFSNYVNGTVGLGFSQTRDLIYRTQDGAPRTTRSIRLEAAASVRF